jgi:hypothetical protein
VPSGSGEVTRAEPRTLVNASSSASGVAPVPRSSSATDPPSWRAPRADARSRRTRRPSCAPARRRWRGRRAARGTGRAGPPSNRSRWAGASRAPLPASVGPPDPRRPPEQRRRCAVGLVEKREQQVDGLGRRVASRARTAYGVGQGLLAAGGQLAGIHRRSSLRYVRTEGAYGQMVRRATAGATRRGRCYGWHGGSARARAGARRLATAGPATWFSSSRMRRTPSSPTPSAESRCTSRSWAMSRAE